jgi:hypothetical protein
LFEDVDLMKSFKSALMSNHHLKSLTLSRKGLFFFLINIQDEMKFIHIFLQGPWENESLKHLFVYGIKFPDQLLKDFFQLNTPLKTIICGSNGLDLTNEFKLNTNVTKTNLCKSGILYNYYVERNRELEKIKLSFKVPISRIMVFDVHFKFK